MPLTRRQFSTAAASVMAVAVMGCDARSGKADTRQTGASGANTNTKGKKRYPSKLAKAPFLIGPPSRYAQTGIYQDYEGNGVWIVSDSQTLVVLSSTCTHLACATQLDQAQDQFVCPCHESRFDSKGINHKGSKAKRPLERCALRLVSGQIEVDPTRRFRKEKDQWIDPTSSLKIG